jgi:hypothetical protein
MMSADIGSYEPKVAKTSQTRVKIVYIFVVLPALKKSGHQERKSISPRDDRTYKIL